MGRPKGSTNKPKVENSSPKNTSSGVKQFTTAAERIEWYKENSEKAKGAFKQLRDVTKNVKQQNLTTYSKEKIVDFLKDVTRYENELRNLSRYLFYRSQVYFRLIMYNATMFDLNARRVIPNYDPTKDNDKNKMLKSYYETLKMLEVMDLQHEMLPILINNFIEDVFYGVCWLDETGMLILQIPPEYCRISGQYFTNDYCFSIDMSRYKKFEDILELLGDPLWSMYKAYGGDNKKKFQQLPDEFTICTKFHVENWETIVPPYSGLFFDLIKLLDLGGLESIADEQQIYKMIYATIPTISGANGPDEWAVDIDLALDYYKKLEEQLPESVGSAITPLPLDTLSFNEDSTTDVTKVQKATKEVLNTSGGAQILNSSSITGAEAFRLAMKVDTEFAISALLGQIEGWTNRMLSYHVSNPAKVKFFEVSAYTKQELKESLQKDQNYGYPNVLALNTLNGISELETLSMCFFENEVLNLQDKFKVLQTSSTQSGSDTGGAPEKDTLTDSGEETRDKDKNQ